MRSSRYIVRLNKINHAMFVTTTFTIEGYQIVAYKGLVRGIIVRAPTIAQGFFGGLKNIIGGRIGAYTEMRGSRLTHPC